MNDLKLFATIQIIASNDRIRIEQILFCKFLTGGKKLIAIKAIIDNQTIKKSAFLPWSKSHKNACVPYQQKFISLKKFIICWDFIYL